MNKVVNRTSKYPRRVSKQGDTFSFGLVVKWTIWGSTKQWFHKLLAFYACLSVWLHKNDLYCLLKILIPGLLFQSFLSGNMCFTRLCSSVKTWPDRIWNSSPWQVQHIGLPAISTSQIVFLNSSVDNPYHIGKAWKEYRYQQTRFFCTL